MANSIYEQNILARKADLRHKRTLARYDRALRGENPFCGDSLEVQVLFAPDGSLADIGFTGYACMVCEVAGDMLCEDVIGKQPAAVLQLDLDSIEALLGMKVPSARIRCALLVLDTLKTLLAPAPTEPRGKVD
jgi:NifU-like protein involved in Fe-S cluster formation